MSDRNGETSAPIMAAFERLDYGAGGHAAGAFPTASLTKVERYLPKRVKRTAETGCGKSTILFSNISDDHHVFALDDRAQGDASSVNFYEECPLTKREHITAHFGPTQRTVPLLEHQAYDAVLIDGPHGWPFPEIEYYFFYPHIVAGGLLILDDVPIPTIGRMADILAEDDMWELVEIVCGITAIFRRTSAPLFDPLGDGWWLQKYNRHRVSPRREIFIKNNELKDEVSSQLLDSKLHI